MLTEVLELEHLNSDK